MLSILWNSNTGWVLLSTMILGIAAGTIGCMAYWKKQNLMSDALSHAALPGIVLAFLIVGEKICLHLSLVLRLVHCLVHFLFNGLQLQAESPKIQRWVWCWQSFMA